MIDFYYKFNYDLVHYSHLSHGEYLIIDKPSLSGNITGCRRGSAATYALNECMAAARARIRGVAAASCSEEAMLSSCRDEICFIVQKKIKLVRKRKQLFLTLHSSTSPFHRVLSTTSKAPFLSSDL